MTEKQLIAMRVENLSLVPVPISPIEIESAELSKVNAELMEVGCANEDEIINAAVNADVILTIFARITRRVLESLPRLKVIVSYGIGYDTIDVDAATDNGVLVVNIPDFCLEEVSDHAIALMLACSRQIVRLNDGAKHGYWNESKAAISLAAPPYEQTIGLVGCGNIGRLTAKKAQCFGLKTIGYDPFADKSLASEYGITLVSLPELLKESDFVSLHTPLNKETWHLIGENELKQMKPTAYLINTARGSVVDEPALIRALQEKWIAGAALDVFEKEPIDAGNPLLKMGNVIITPHCASASASAIKRLKISVAQEAARVLTGKWPRNVVNKTVKPKVKLV